MNQNGIPILRLDYTQDDIDYINNGVEEVLRSGYLTMGDKVAQFEKEFSEFVGTKYGIATNSGTSSLEIVLRAIGIEGCTVIVPSNTFMATAIAVVHAGGRVVFADCEKNNLQLDPDDLKKQLQSDTRGVILVHIGGIISPHLDEIRNFCGENGLFLLEDAAHAHGSSIDGRKAGALGIAGSFSFYPTKVFVTGEGGMITTDDEEIHRKALILREHGKESPNENIHTEMGYNWRFSEMHAVLGLLQMKKAETILAERRRIARMYDKRLGDVKGITRLEIPLNIESSYYKYIVFLDETIDRDSFKERMDRNYKVKLTGEVYSHPCHSQPVFETYPDMIANLPFATFPGTAYVSQRHICLPLYPGLIEEEVDYVVDSLKRTLQ